MLNGENLSTLKVVVVMSKKNWCAVHPYKCQLIDENLKVNDAPGIV